MGETWLSIWFWLQATQETLYDMWLPNNNRFYQILIINEHDVVVLSNLCITNHNLHYQRVSIHQLDFIKIKISIFFQSNNCNVVSIIINLNNYRSKYQVAWRIVIALVTKSRHGNSYSLNTSLAFLPLIKERFCRPTLISKWWFNIAT